MDRNAAGSDINPVAYCVSSAKAKVPFVDSVLKRIQSLESTFRRVEKSSLLMERNELPLFFRYAYSSETLIELLFVRKALAWRTNEVDTFVAALVLGSLHGEMDKSRAYFSNQMPRTISPKPNYSIKYWRKHCLSPPKRNVFALLKDKAQRRLAGELPREEAPSP